MFEKFYPDLYINSVFELPLDLFEQRGIKALVFDIDNTLTPFDVAYPGPEIIDLFDFLKKRGFKPLILSNNNKQRVHEYNSYLKVPCIYKGGKPLANKLLKLIKSVGEKPETSAFIGDQIFTDVLCGHNAGMLSIYCRPICKRDQLVTKIKRPLDKIVLNEYFKKMC